MGYLSLSKNASEKRSSYSVPDGWVADRHTSWRCWTAGTGHIPGGTEWEGAGFHHATQNSMQFKMYELFISGNFHLIFLDCG